MDFKQQEQYKKQLDWLREQSEIEEFEFHKLKENNPKYVKEIKEVFEVSGFHIEHTTFEKPLIRGFERTDESIAEAMEKRQESLELRQELQEELDAFSAKYPFVSKDDAAAMAELKAIKEKFKDDLVKRKDSERRTIKRLKTIVQSNFDEWTHLITIEYHYNEMDIERAKEHFKQWAKDMRKLNPNFIYVYVMEFQERGAIHFHVICRCVREDGTWYKNKDFKKIVTMWKHGHTDVAAIHQKNIPKKLRDKAKAEMKIENEKIIAIWSLGSYLTSYLEKGSDNMLLFGNRMFGYSRGLKDSIRITDPKKIAHLRKYFRLDELKENSYKIDLERAENKVFKQFYNKLIKKYD